MSMILTIARNDSLGLLVLVFFHATPAKWVILPNRAEVKISIVKSKTSPRPGLTKMDLQGVEAKSISSLNERDPELRPRLKLIFYKKKKPTPLFYFCY